VGATLDLINFIRDLKYSNLEPEIIEKAKLCILDLVGVALAGTGTDVFKIILHFSKGNFRKGNSTVFVKGEKFSECGASFLNAIAASSLDMDDGNRLAMGHPGSAIIPAALAVAEAKGTNPKEFLAAIVAGYEVAVRISMSRTPFFMKHQYSTGIWGGFGAVVAVGKILHFNEHLYQCAFGTVAAYSPFPPSNLSLKLNESMVKESIGWTCFTGCCSALMAENGFTGSYDILDDPSRYQILNLANGLGKNYAILNTYFKPYACCRWAHSTIDGVLYLVKKYNIHYRYIKEIRVKIFYEASRLSQRNSYKPRTIIEAQYSLPFSVALALFYNKLGPEELTESNLQNDKILELAKKVKITVDPELNRLFPQKTVAKIEIFEKDKVFETTVEYPRGNPERPLSNEELEDKFRSLTSKFLGNSTCTEVVEKIYNLEKLENLGTLMKMLTC